MSHDDFIWLPEIVEKLNDKHQVDSDEVEEVFEFGPRYFRGQKVNVPGKMYIMRLDKQQAGGI